MIKKILAVITALILLIFLALTLIITPAGLRASLSVVNKFTSYKIHYKTITGSMLSPISIQDFSLNSPNLQISAKSISAEWSLYAYLKKTINISTLHADDVTINIRAAKQNDNTQTSLTFPYQFDLKNIKISNLSIKQNTQTLLHSANIGGHFIAKKNDLDSDILIYSKQPLPWSAHTIISGQLQSMVIQQTIRCKQQTWKLTGQTKNGLLYLKTLNNKIFSGIFNLNAQLQFSPLKWQANINAHHINLSEFDKHIPKSIDLQITSTGKKNQNKIETKSRINLQSANNKLTFNLNTHQQLQLNWRINCKHLGLFIPELSGDLQSKGQYIKKNKRFLVSGSIQSNQLSYHSDIVNLLQANWSLASNNNKTSLFVLKAQSGQYSSLKIGKTNITAKGDFPKHSIKLNTIINGIKASLSLNANATDKSWISQIHTIKLELNKIILKNKKPILFSLQNNEIQIPHFCLYQSADTSLCADFNMNSNRTWGTSIQANKIPYSYLNPFLQPGMQGSGAISLQAKLSGDKKTIQSATAKIQLLQIKLATLKDNFIQKINKIKAKLNYKNHDLKSIFNMIVDNNSTASANLTINNLNSQALSSATINGKVTSHIKNIAVFNQLTHHVHILNGKFNANFNVSGALSHPKIDGAATIFDANIYSPNLGITFNNITSIIKSSKTLLKTDTTLNIRSHALSMHTKTNLRSPSYDTNGTITGNQVLIYNTPQYTLYASPNVKIKASTQGLHLSGDVTIPKATIQPIQGTDIITLPESDIQYVNHNDSRFSLPFSFSLYTKLEDGIHIKVSGINANVSGRLLLKKKTNHPIFASGDISIVKGNYKIYGNKLSISKNSALIFSNSLITEPNISLSATKTFLPSASGFSQGMNDHIIAGVKVTGSINHPQLSLFSIPATLNQTQILSYLLLGHPLDVAAKQSKDQQSFFNALNALKLAQSGLASKHGGGFIDSIRSKLGLSELDINSQTTSDALGNTVSSAPQTSFVISKRLTKHFLLKYIQDFSTITPLNIFQVIFYLSPQWSIQASSSFSSSKNDSTSQISINSYYNGVDIMYSFGG